MAGLQSSGKKKDSIYPELISKQPISLHGNQSIPEDNFQV